MTPGARGVADRSVPDQILPFPAGIGQIKAIQTGVSEPELFEEHGVGGFLTCKRTSGFRAWPCGINWNELELDPRCGIKSVTRCIYEARPGSVYAGPRR